MTAERPLILGLVFASLLALGGCGSQGSEEETAKADQAGLALAIAAPMMVDPALTTRNRAESAIGGGAPPIIILPPFSQGADLAAAAKAEAEKLFGGSIPSAPFGDGDGDADPVLRDAVTAAQRARAIKGPGRDCAAKADYALSWSLQLPQALPIYPRGHLLEAAGSNTDGCKLRVVRFVTPVEAKALVDFYHARARTAGFVMRIRADETTHQLTGSKGGAEFAVQARQRDDGLTEADIVTNGL